MKNCPYCAEEIQDEAIKCKHCGEFLDGTRSQASVAPNKLPWYFRTSAVVIALLSVGPLALPMIWWHPRLNVTWKFGISVATLVVTWYAYKSTVGALHMLEDNMKMLQGNGAI